MNREDMTPAALELLNKVNVIVVQVTRERHGVVIKYPGVPLPLAYGFILREQIGPWVREQVAVCEEASELKLDLNPRVYDTKKLGL